MSESTVRFTVSFTIHEGKRDAAEEIVQAMVEGSKQEAGTLGYAFYLSSDGAYCRLLETYADANAVLAHMTGPVVQEYVPKVLGVADLSGFEVYGDPGPQATEILKSLGAQIFNTWHGFTR